MPLEKDKETKIGDKGETENYKKNLEENADDDLDLEEANKSNYVLTLTQIVTQSKGKKSKKVTQNDSLFEPLSQVSKIAIEKL